MREAPFYKVNGKLKRGPLIICICCCCVALSIRGGGGGDCPPPLNTALLLQSLHKETNADKEGVEEEELGV